MKWFGSSAASDAERQVADYMSRLAGVSLPVAPRLPGADAVWMRAQMLRRWDEQRRALAPVAAMERVQIAAGLATAAVLLVRSFPALLQVLGRG